MLVVVLVGLFALCVVVGCDWCFVCVLLLLLVFVVSYVFVADDVLCA